LNLQMRVVAGFAGAGLLACLACWRREFISFSEVEGLRGGREDVVVQGAGAGQAEREIITRVIEP
jgi:hypothetical protein